MNDKVERTSTAQTKGSRGIFAVLLIACMICCFLQTALNTAVPVIMFDFQISASAAQWLTSAYSLTMGVMIPATAFLIRRFSAKKLFIIFMALFSAGAFLSALASSFPVLMFGRILQALGCGVIMSLTQVVTLTVYPPEKRGVMMGIYGLAVGAIPVFSPTLAGFVVDGAGWPAIFWAAAILGAVVLFVGFKFVSNPLETVKQRFDTPSMILCAAGFGGLTLGLGNISSHDVIATLVPLLIGCVSLILFAIRQFRMKEPFLDVRLLKNRELRFGVAGSMLMYCAMIAGSTLLPLYLQSMRGFSAADSGLVTMPGSLAMAAISPFAGKIYDKIGIRKPLYIGSALLTVSCAGLCFLTADTSILYISALFFLRLLAIGLMMAPLSTWGLSTTSAKDMANGSALLTSLRTIAGSIGSAVFVAVMTAVSASNGNANPIYGVNIAFIGITAVSAVLFAASLIFVKEKSRINISQTIPKQNGNINAVKSIYQMDERPSIIRKEQTVMNEMNEKDDNGFIAYEYKEVTAAHGMEDLYADNYPNFGWELDSATPSATGLSRVSMKFRRDRKIRNKAELSRLQRQFETGVNEIGHLEKSKTTPAFIAALTVGLAGTALLAGATFAFIFAAMIPLMVVLAVPGFVGWFLPYLIYKKIAAIKSAAAEPLIENQYDSIYSACAQGRALLAD